MIDLRNPGPVLAELCAIAQAAGEAILEVYGSEFSVQLKDDRSPLTEADRVPHRIIGERLRALDDALPMLSEESAPQDIVATPRVDALLARRSARRHQGILEAQRRVHREHRARRRETRGARRGACAGPRPALLRRGRPRRMAHRAAGARRSRSASARTRRRLCGSSAAAATATVSSQTTSPPWGRTSSSRWAARSKYVSLRRGLRTSIRGSDPRRNGTRRPPRLSSKVRAGV